MHDPLDRLIAAATHRRTKTPSRVEQNLLAQSVGERMREAREMAGFSQIRAAALLGYANSSKLAKIETAAQLTIPLWLLKKAAALYECSVDYLLGNAQSMDAREHPHEVARDAILLMREEWERMRWRDMVVTQSLARRLAACEALISLIDQQADEARAALSRLAELNPQYEDMPGGSRVEASVDRLHASARMARARLLRLKHEARAARGQPPQTEIDLLVV